MWQWARATEFTDLTMGSSCDLVLRVLLALFHPVGLFLWRILTNTHPLWQEGKGCGNPNMVFLISVLLSGEGWM